MKAVEEHPGDALSALVDGELGTDEAATVRAHVEECRTCAEELHGVRASRLALRTLPGVDPPPAAMAALIDAVRSGAGDGPQPTAAPVIPFGARRRRVGPAAASVAASAAVLVLGASALAPQGRPPRVAAAVDSHASSVEAMVVGGLVSADNGDQRLRPSEPVTPTTAAPRDASSLPAPYAAPEVLDGGYRLVGAFAHPSNRDGLQLVYASDRYALSVFETPGQLDLGALPAGGRRVDVGGAEGWRWETPEVAGRVVAYEQDGLVVIVVGDEPGPAVLDAARSLPPPRPTSLAQRVRQIGVDVLEALSP